MAKYESEVRFMISDIEDFRKRLRELDVKLIYDYEFSDHYFRPKKMDWNLLYKNIRIREWSKPKEESEVLLNRTNIIKGDNIIFKRSIYPQGKIRLFKGKFYLCKEILNDLEFEEWFTIEKRDYKFLEVPKYNFKVVYEFVEKLGWMSELETNGENIGEAEKELEREMKVLKIKEITYKPLSLIYMERFL